MSKPRQTVADYMVIALSPVLIMMLVGSLCFFLIEVFYRGKMMGGVSWIMFWFIIGIVFVSRIAIEESPERAAVFGVGLAMATWMYMIRTQPAYLIGIALLAIVWFCAHKLVWDCTLIDDDQDSSGQGLLQKAADPIPAKVKSVPGKKPARKVRAPHAPGKWVVYFSVAALPLFGLGQMLLPAGAPERRAGFIFLFVYLTAALGLLVTTSFLGLRRYLRQRYLKMPPVIALAWLRFGIGVAAVVLVGAIFLPRPGANAAWAGLRYQIDYQIAKASKYATAPNAPGQGGGRPGNDTGGKKGNASTPSEEQGQKPSAAKDKPGQKVMTPNQPALPTPAGAGPNMYNLFRTVFWIIVVLVIVGWIFRRRGLLLEMFRSIVAALKDFFRKLFDLMPARKAFRKIEAAPMKQRFSAFAEYKNPFFNTREHAWPPGQIIIYSFEAVQVWAREQGMAVSPEMTAREFCDELGRSHGEMDAQFNHLARLYAHAAYGAEVPSDINLEPLRELWRQLPVAARTVA